MMRFFRPLALHVLSLAVGVTSGASDLGTLFAERLASVVAVEFTIETELDRRQHFVSGAVIDDKGTIIIPGGNLLPHVAMDQLKDFKVYLPNSDTAMPATYLGPNVLTGFYYLRLNEASSAAKLKPFTDFAISPRTRLGDELWGIGLRGKDENFAPYVLSSRVALVAKLPNQTAITAQDVGGPGLPVFTMTGELAGLALNPFGQNFLLFSRNQNGTPIMLVNAEESSVVLLAEEFLPYLQRIPENTAGRPVSWLGIYGMQPVDPDVAKLLKLEGRAGLVLSDLKADGPAAKAGLKDRDIVLAIDGEPLPRLKPDRVVVGYFGQAMLKRRPGEKVTLTALRGAEEISVEVVLGDEPKMVREAERKYFEQFGFTAREFLAADSIMHRAAGGEHGGAVVHFLKPNGAAAAAGLRPDDWIREIDGVVVTSYAAALEKLASLEGDAQRKEFVLLTSRGGETQVLRIKLN
ncbi:MAG: PDZ domain-containing protein [Candidatus Didemnitutus sp.]|nr:PDZ domain-containing protein [Candidatus Didemnitutus sp.]